MNSPLWLSHHQGPGLARCFVIGGYHVCARCLGLVPALVATMLLESYFPVHLPVRLALALEAVLAIPCLWDVVRGLGLAPDAPEIGSNLLRFLTGLGLGIALGHASTVGHAQGFGAPEALFPIVAATAAVVWTIDAARRPVDG